MTEKLGRGAQKLQQFLNDAGCDVQVQELPDSTRTAVDAATAIGCELGQIAKSLVFAHGETEQLVLVIAAGAVAIAGAVATDAGSAASPVPSSGNEALRKPSRTRWLAGGRAPLPAARAARRAIDAARPDDEDGAGMRDL